MSILSMTGFAREVGAFEDWAWTWQVKAVNGKSLDVRLKLPAGFESLEIDIRKQVGAALSRGNLQITLSFQTEGAAQGQSINHEVLANLVAQAKPYIDNVYVAPPRLDGLLSIKGVMVDVADDASSDALGPRNDKIMESLARLLGKLNKARQSEGAAMEDVLRTKLTTLASLTDDAKIAAKARPDAMFKALSAKFQELLGQDLPADRLAQEAALLAVKADVSEEVERLDAHFDQGLTLLNQGSPIGRKLDFLAQEFIREINTLCSKSSDIDLTRIGLEMKSQVEQFREQAANVE